MKDLIISDLHLYQGQQSVPELFSYFMDQIAPNSDNLYVLGDLFEYWVGDDFQNEFQQSIIDRFCNYSKQHGLYFIHGNRDFLLGDDFFQKTKGTLLTDPCQRIVGDKKTLLMHGDSLCTKDIEYQKFRSMVRSELWQQQFLQQPLATRIELAKNLRDSSMKSQSQMTEEIMDVDPESVEKVMINEQVDRLIHGHTHRQFHHYINVKGKDAERIVLGDWGAKGNYCLCENKSVNIIDFQLPSDYIYP